MNQYNYIEYNSNGTLCLKASWLCEVVNLFSNDNYHKLRRRGKLLVSKSIHDARVALVHYDVMPERFKSKVLEILGCSPYELVVENKLTDLLELDTVAKQYFEDYTFEQKTEFQKNTRPLPEDKKKEYTANANILNAVRKAIQTKDFFRTSRGGTKLKQWDSIVEAVSKLPKTTWPHNLPTNPRSFQNKYKAYLKDSYFSLIHKGFQNCNSEKINNEARLWLVSRYANQVEKVASFMQLFHEYNAKAMTEGWKQLKHYKSIEDFLNQSEIKVLWYGFRHDELTAKERSEYQFSTKMPTMRDSLWYGDGTKMNLYYKNDDGNMETCQVYEVMDAFSELFLGYHVSKTEDYKAQYFAYKMAANVSGQRPYQITYDNQGGHKKLESANFINNLARLSIKTQPHNGKSKTIESAFGRFQMQYLKRDWFFTGQNITASAQESKVRMEFILENKSNLPTLPEAIEAYKKRRHEWNSAPHFKSGIPKIQMYEQSVNPKCVKLTLNDIVDLFWLERKDTIKVNSYGITFTDQKVKYTYMVHSDNQLPNIEWLAYNIDKSVTIKYDPSDRSKIWLYENTKLGMRFLAEATTKIETARGKQEQETWEAEFYTKVIAMRKQLRVDINDKMYSILDQHKATAEHYGLNTPRLKGIETSKAKRKQAKEKQAKRMQKAQSIAEYQKELSNMDAIVEPVKVPQVVEVEDQDDDYSKYY